MTMQEFTNQPDEEQQLPQDANESCTRINTIIDHLFHTSKESMYEEILELCTKLKTYLTHVQTTKAGVIINEPTFS